MSTLNLETAKELLHKNVQNQNLRRHCYAVGKALAAYYDYYQSQNIDTGNLTKDQWELVGMLHDSDWELTTSIPHQHTLMLLQWLKDYDVPEDILNVFRSHNTKLTNLRDPETLLEWTLECADELTGFIVATALMMPSKKLSEVTLEGVFKKFKKKEFARQVDRDQILQCDQKLNIPQEKFVDITLKAMQSESELLGL